MNLKNIKVYINELIYHNNSWLYLIILHFLLHFKIALKIKMLNGYSKTFIKYNAVSLIKIVNKQNAQKVTPIIVHNNSDVDDDIYISDRAESLNELSQIHLLHILSKTKKSIWLSKTALLSYLNRGRI